MGYSKPVTNYVNKEIITKENGFQLVLSFLQAITYQEISNSNKNKTLFMH